MAEPFNALAETLKVGKILRFTGDVWKDHACCVVLMHEHDLSSARNGRRKWSTASSRRKPGSATTATRPRTLLSKDNPAQYTPHTYETLAQVLAPHAGVDAQVRGIGRHRSMPTGTKSASTSSRIRSPATPKNWSKMLKQTARASAATTSCRQLDPAFVARDLVDDRFVKKAIADIGGMSAFGLPNSFTRQRNDCAEIRRNARRLRQEQIMRNDTQTCPATLRAAHSCS